MINELSGKKNLKTNVKQYLNPATAFHDEEKFTPIL